MLVGGRKFNFISAALIDMKNLIIASFVMALAACSNMESEATSVDSNAGNPTQPGLSSENLSGHRALTSKSEPAPSTGTQQRTQGGELVYQCPDYTSDCTADDPLVAASNEEAEWLSENGYPSIQTLKKYETITLEELRGKQNKSQIDTLMLSEKMAEKNERNNGKALAHSVAMQGNLYALYVLSEIHAMPGPGFDRIESGAYLRLAYLMGDSKAADFYHEIYGSLSAPEHLLIDRRASRLMQTMSLTPKKPRPMQ